MIPDSNPTSSRGRKTLVLASSLFLLAALFTGVSRLSDNEPPSADVIEEPFTQRKQIALADTTHFPSDSVAVLTATSSRGVPSVSANAKTLSGTVATGNATRSSTGPIIAILILCFGGVLAMWLKRRQAGVSTPNQIESLARLSLPNNQEIRLIRVKGHEMLIGSSQTAISMLHQFGSAQSASDSETELEQPNATDDAFDTALNAAILASQPKVRPEAPVTIHV